MFLNALLLTASLSAVDHLPPLTTWQGQSERLLQPTNPLATQFELSNGVVSPNYQDTMAYLDKLASENSAQFKIDTIGTSDAGRSIKMLIASETGQIDKNKATILLQAGIHSGEIDGKDATFMLLRDIAQGQRNDILKRVNLLFIPILNVDGHENASRFNRINQRGPEVMGFRTNGRNLNLNRDYTKLETPGVQAVMRVINQYQPDMYVDMHVTDGADYQYDITYGSTPKFASESPKIAAFIEDKINPAIDAKLTRFGHTPGPLVFVMNKRELSEGLAGWVATPRYSNGWGDLNNLPTILLENHSLKPYKQRVLGTYVFLDGVIDAVSSNLTQLRRVVKIEKDFMPRELVVARSYSKTPKHIDFLGIEYEKFFSELSNQQEVRYTGKAKTYAKLPIFWREQVVEKVKVPTAYYLPKSWSNIAAKLQNHGIKLERAYGVVDHLKQIQVVDHQFAKAPFEDRLQVFGKFDYQNVPSVDLSDYFKISTAQISGKLAVHLLQPEAEDSFFSWGYFNSIFQRTEYSENYALLPFAEKMLAEDAVLKREFEDKLAADKEFKKSPKKRLEWLYSKTPFYDGGYLHYPVLIDYE
ncbi:M14 family metallopeptidase [Pseudoalteromonas sp. SSM20]|uniref:M14 family metallopeptidase n=1 Tax=Pseudoalteromonas sp. SSM20 TaxID=3139394 RepID=UPI003BA94C24